MANNRPDLFVHTINTLLGGSVANELSEKLTECVEASRNTGRKSSITLTLNIKPTGRDTGQYEIRDDIKVKIPELDRGMTLMFGTPDGNLQRDDPRQQKLDLKVAETPKPETFKTAGNN